LRLLQLVAGPAANYKNLLLVSTCDAEKEREATAESHENTQVPDH
jgi:hypothetical protein